MPSASVSPSFVAQLPLLLLLTVPALVGCDEEGTFIALDAATRTGPGSSAGTAASCPELDSGEVGRTGPCCYTKNQGNTDMPELRMAQLRISRPTTFDSGIFNNLLDNIIWEISFNWLFQFEVNGGDVLLRTGNGTSNGEGGFLFDTLGDVYPLATTPATITDNTIIAVDPVDLTVPVIRPARDGGGVNFSLPLRQITLTRFALETDRSCVGSFESTEQIYTVDGCTLDAYFLVDEVDANTVNTGGISTTLCAVAAGLFGAGILKCDGIARAEWENRPDALCTDTGCAVGNCDPLTTCNAWYILAACSAHGVEIP